MKKIVLSFVLVLTYGILFAQNNGETRSDIVKDKETGDIVRGKQVAYQVTREDKIFRFDDKVFELGPRDRFYEIKNVNLPDTLLHSNSPQGAPLTNRMRNQIREVVLEQFKPEDSASLLSIAETEKSYKLCTICFVLDENFKIKNITFFISGQSDFWMNLPVDYFFRMEKAVMEMDLDVSNDDEAWIEDSRLWCSSGWGIMCSGGVDIDLG